MSEVEERGGLEMPFTAEEEEEEEEERWAESW